MAAAAAMSASGLGLLASPAGATTTSPAPSVKAAACDKAPWEAKVQGAPAGFGAGSPSGDYLCTTRTAFTCASPADTAKTGQARRAVTSSRYGRRHD